MRSSLPVEIQQPSLFEPPELVDLPVLSTGRENELVDSFKANYKGWFIIDGLLGVIPFLIPCLSS